MCGRFALFSSPEQLAEQFRLASVPVGLLPHYNLAPSQELPVIRYLPGFGRELQPLHWGLIPSWAHDPSIARRLINARSESVAEKPSFRSALRTRRCLIPANGFYEWEATSEGKQPWWISPKEDSLLAIAGLWEHWESSSGELIESCTLLTCEANDDVAPIHPRMPLILPPEAQNAWLDPPNQPAARLATLIAQPPIGLLQRWQVSTQVNSPLKESARLISPLRRTPHARLR